MPQTTVPPGHFVVPLAYIDSASLQDKYYFPGELKINEQAAAAAFIEALTPQLKEAQVDAKGLGVAFSWVGDTQNKMTIKDFAAAGGHVYVIPTQGSQLLSKILLLEEDMKKEEEKLIALEKLIELLQRSVCCENEQKIADLSKEEDGSDFGANMKESEDEKQILEEEELELKMNKVNFEKLLAHVVRMCAIIVLQLLQTAWSRLTPDQQVDASQYRYYTLHACANPTFTAEDSEGVEHAMRRLHDVPPRAMNSVRAAFKVVFGRDAISAQQRVSHNSAVALRKAVEALQKSRDAQLKAMQSFMAAQSTTMNEFSKAMQAFMAAQSKAMNDFFEGQNAASCELLSTLTDIVQTQFGEMSHGQPKQPAKNSTPPFDNLERSDAERGKKEVSKNVTFDSIKHMVLQVQAVMR